MDFGLRIISKILKDEIICFSALSEGTILDSHQLISLYMLSQLLERELDKCQRLVAAIPMDMTAFYGKNTYLEQSREMRDYTGPS